MHWQWLPFACVLPVALYAILGTLYRSSDRVAEVLTALFSGPRAPRIGERDHWRSVHRAADRRAPFVTGDPRPAAPIEQGKRA